MAATQHGSIRFTVNAVARTLAVAPHVPLLEVLRNDLGLNGPKFGCGLGECGACTVLIDGRAARACVVPMGNMAGRTVVTLEALGTAARPHPIQQAFIDAQAAQCGYCLNGMIMSTKALLDANPDPTPEQVREALRYNLCRCGTHIEILDAVMRAARMLAASPGAEPA
jgi:nicotinate dehydrogenase subunit A